ncbi:MAG: hypothetical protein CSA11_03515 [Chloroflexi bacterium]|nr:MAG: hypothetical protein CSA11_03515 [Chloroflexota bacterium]
MAVYETTYATTSYEIIETPFTQENQQEETLNPFLEVPYQWQNQRFKTSRSPLEQRMMVIPALAGLMSILLVAFALPNLALGASDQALTGTGIAVVSAQTNEVETAVTTALTGSISPVFSKEVKHWEPQILNWATLYNLDPDIIATIMQIESCGDPNAVSSAGAQGLFQVMPFHFEAGEDMQYPDTNAFRGMKFYNTMLAHTGGDVMLSFAGYNGGYAASDSPYDQWPAETQRYLYWAQGIYEDAKAGASESTRLQEWLNAGGLGLCQQAAARLGMP